MQLKLDLPQFLNVATGYWKAIKIIRKDLETFEELRSHIGEVWTIVAFEDGKYFRFENKQWIPVEAAFADKVRVKLTAVGVLKDNAVDKFEADFPSSAYALEFWKQVDRKWIKFTEDEIVFGIQKVQE